MTTLFRLDSTERRDALVGFLLLIGVMAAHAMMETARDTLFLTRLPARQLPWAYLAIAVLTLGAARLNYAVLPGLADKRRALTATLLLAATGTIVLWGLLGATGALGAFVLYVWAGLLATVVVVQVWLVLENVVTVTQAKRIFAFVAAGGVSGATLGALAADRIIGVVGARALLLLAAALMVLVSAAPLLWRRERLMSAAGRRSSREPQPTTTLRVVAREPYLRNVLVLVLVSSVAVTTVDFLFKSVVEGQVASAQLGAFFARFHLVLNATALVVQVLLSSWLFSKLGVSRALLLVPILLIATTAGFAFAPGLIAAVVLRATEGSLRHTVHRTGLEVLYLPMHREVRERYKTFIDGVGGRTGQALASVALLAAVALGGGPLHFAVAIAALAALWLGILLTLKGRYVELFRHSVREGTIETRVGLAELDLHSLESLVRALNSENDEEVLTALDLFEHHDKEHLVPVLVLYHPSRDIVRRALQTFSRSGRRDFHPVARRLLRADDPHVRAAALRALTIGESDASLLRRGLEDESPIVHATALVGLLSHGSDDPGRLRAALNRCIQQGSPETRRALAMAIRDRRDDAFGSTLLRLAGDRDPGVRLEVARAMEAVPSIHNLPALLPMLAHGRLREAARRAILACGPQALSFLDEALWNLSLPRKVRRHVPRTVSRFASRRAAEVLLRHLPHEEDGMVRYKILRGLGRLHTDHPELPIDREVVGNLARQTLSRVIQILDWRLATERAQRQAAELQTTGGELLVGVLREKERHGLERVFRLVGLLDPKEDFQLLYQGLASEAPKVRAASREVLTHVLPSSLREPLLALVSEAPDAERLRRAAAATSSLPHRPSYDERLASMLTDRSEAVRSVAAYHIGELGLGGLAPALREARPAGQGPLSEVFDRALTALGAERAKRVSHVA